MNLKLRAGQVGLEFGNHVEGISAKAAAKALSPVLVLGVGRHRVEPAVFAVRAGPIRLAVSQRASRLAEIGRKDEFEEGHRKKSLRSGGYFVVF